MPRGSNRQWLVLVGCVLLVCSLLVTSTIVLGHDHAPGGPHSCEVCHLGYMGWANFPVATGLVPELMEQLLEFAEPVQLAEECVLRDASSRAPPVTIVLPA
jgi:hypothetical protein